MKSKFFSLSFKDFCKGSIVALLTGIMTALANINNNDITFKEILISAVIALLAYLIKNLFTNSKDELLKTDKL